MSRNQHKKRNFNDSSEVSDNHGCGPCEYDQCNDQRGFIICPPCDYREKYESEYSDYSCPDFSALCEDIPKICCEKKELCKKSNMKPKYAPSEDSEHHDTKYKKKKNHGCSGCEKQCKGSSKCDSCKSCRCNRCSERSSSESSESESGCGGCGGHCGGSDKCDRCKSCGCRECSDYSRSSVLSALGGSESQSECPRFDNLACDQKKKCCDVSNPCKKHKEPTRQPVHRKEPVTQKEQYSSQSEKRESASASSSSKGKKFIVTFRSKEGHQWAEYHDGNKSIHINGKNGPVLHLYRGCTYFFCVEQIVPSGEDPEHSLILTNNPSGGSGCRMIPNSFSPVPRGCVCLKVDESTPRYFFYQDYKNAYAGGLVIVHDK